MQAVRSLKELPLVTEENPAPKSKTEELLGMLVQAEEEVRWAYEKAADPLQVVRLAENARDIVLAALLAEQGAVKK